ncbi:MAG: CocE/NonD family hydrolase C-terminal non-catalytic domain-containing protein [Kouleothrix sp.]
MPGQFSGPRDQRTLEARADLPCYTSAPLERDLDVIGPVRLVLFVRSSLAHTDFLGRLCDVYPDGRSINICDGLLRLAPGSGARQPTAACGSRSAVEYGVPLPARPSPAPVLASGAHPRWSRNLGLGQPLASAVLMRVAEQAVFHDPAHPSALLLPVI